MLSAEFPKNGDKSETGRWNTSSSPKQIAFAVVLAEIVPGVRIMGDEATNDVRCSLG